MTTTDLRERLRQRLSGGEPATDLRSRLRERLTATAEAPRESTAGGHPFVLPGAAQMVKRGASQLGKAFAVGGLQTVAGAAEGGAVQAGEAVSLVPGIKDVIGGSALAGIGSRLGSIGIDNPLEEAGRSAVMRGVEQSERMEPVRQAITQTGQQIGQHVRDAAERMGYQRSGGLMGLAEDVVGAVPQVLGGAAAGTAAGLVGGPIAGMATAAGWFALTDAGNETSATYQRLIAEGVPEPEAAQRASQAGLMYGAASGVLEYVGIGTVLRGTKLLGHMRRAAGNKAVQAAGRTLAAGAGEGLTEAAQGVLGEGAQAWAREDWDEFKRTWADLDIRGREFLVGAILGTGVRGGVEALDPSLYQSAEEMLADIEVVPQATPPRSPEGNAEAPPTPGGQTQPAPVAAPLPESPPSIGPESASPQPTPTVSIRIRGVGAPEPDSRLADGTALFRDPTKAEEFARFKNERQIPGDVPVRVLEPLPGAMEPLYAVVPDTRLEEARARGERESAEVTEFARGAARAAAARPSEVAELGAAPTPAIPVRPAIEPAPQPALAQVAPETRAAAALPSTTAVSPSASQPPSPESTLPPMAAEDERPRMGHRPNAEGPRGHDLLETDLAPDDIYTHPGYYIGDQSSKEARESIAAIRRIKGKPDAEVTVYRAAPAGAKLEPGDWISLSKTYATQHGMGNTEADDLPVMAIKVRARDIRWAGDDLNEFGYFPEEQPQSEAQAALPSTGETQTGGFDPEAFDRERAERIKASKDAGKKHLDDLPPYVETMRGKRVYYVHDPKVKGTVSTVDNRGNVYVDWSDAYSAEKEMASPVTIGKKTVMQTSLGPTDLKDYVVDEIPTDLSTMSRPQLLAEAERLGVSEGAKSLPALRKRVGEARNRASVPGPQVPDQSPPPAVPASVGGTESPRQSERLPSRLSPDDEGSQVPESSVPESSLPSPKSTTPLVLWGRRDGGPWMKLSDNTTRAEMVRREKDGWEVLRYPKGESPEMPTPTPPPVRGEGEADPAMAAEVARLDAEMDAADKAWSESDAASRKAREERDRAGYGTKRREQLEKKAERLAAATDAAWSKFDAARKAWYDAAIRHQAQTGNPIARASARHSIDPQSVTREQVEAVIDQETRAYVNEAVERENDFAGRLAPEADAEAVRMALDEAKSEFIRAPLMATDSAKIIDRVRGAIRGNRLRAYRHQVAKSLADEGITPHGINDLYDADSIDKAAAKLRKQVADEKARLEAEDKQRKADTEQARAAILEHLASAGSKGMTEKALISALMGSGISSGQAGPAFRALRDEGAIELRGEDAKRKAYIAGAAKSPSKRLKDAADKLESEARAANAKLGIPRGRNIGATLPPAYYGNLVKIGAARILKGIAKFAEWANVMVSSEGKWIEPELENLWADAQELARDIEAGSASPDISTADITARSEARKAREAQQTSARKADMDADREALGLDVLDSPARRSWQEALDTAESKGLSEIHRALQLAAEVINAPRAFSDIETAGLVKAAAGLKAQHRKLVDQINAERDSVTKGSLVSQMVQAEQQFDVLSKALRKSGTEKGRALAAQKLTLDADMSLIAVKARARAAKGSELTAEESARIEELTAQLEAANARAAELEAKLREQTAQKAVREHAAESGRKRATVSREAAFQAKLARARELLKAGCR